MATIIKECAVSIKKDRSMEHDRFSTDSIIYGQLTVAKVQKHEWTIRRIFFQQMLLEQLIFHMLKEK